MARLVAKAALADRDAGDLMARLGDSLPDYRATVEARGQVHLVEFAYGSARIEVTRDRLLVEARADDPTSLAFVKGGLAFQIQHLIGAERPGLVWTGDGCDESLPHFRQMVVVSTQAVTPRMRRVRLAGRDLGRFAMGGLHLRLLIPPRGRAPVWPHAGPAALPVWPEGEDRLTLRTYTIRRIDPEAGHLDIDVALHEAFSPGADFALTARPGDVVGILGPGGGIVSPAAFTLLAGDETALPAIGRILEEMPRAAKGVALIEVADGAERQTLAAPAGVEVVWLLRDGRPAGESGMIAEAMKAIDWPRHDDVFAWSGTEFSDFKTLRALFRKERGLKRDRHLAVAYWRRGRPEGDPG